MMVVRQTSPIITKLGPAWFRRWIVDCIPIARTQKLKRVVDILHQTSVKIIEEKKTALRKGEYAAGKDIMSVLRKSLSPPGEGQC